MGKDNRRQMGSVYSCQWATIRLPVKTKMRRGKTNICRCKTFTCYSFRGRKFIRKRCLRACSTFSDQKRFLQYILPRTKENRRSETNNKSSSSEQVHGQTAFSHGYANKSAKSSQAKRLGNFSRSEGRLSASLNSQISQKMSSILHTGQSVSVCSTLFWSNAKSSLLYENNFSSNCTSENADCSSSFVSMLLVGCFGFNGPLRQYFSLYRAVSQREGEKRERIDESKNVQTTPTRTYCKRNRPLPYCNQNCRTPRH